jgi:carbamoyl-phosphate synthase large subunit
VIFEINPRFSSTVMFRHLLGFKDLIWSINEIAGKAIEDYIPPQFGTKFYRASQEVILEGNN